MIVTKKTVASKYRQGSGWVVSSYSPNHKTWSISNEMKYGAACDSVKEARERWNTKEQRYEE